eukprot:977155-Lingulodinium_polyedra.AAC.1
MSKAAQKITRATLMPCLRHPGMQCPLAWLDPALDPNNKPLTAMLAGSSCAPWSSQGTKLGLAHDAAE